MKSTAKSTKSTTKSAYTPLTDMDRVNLAGLVREAHRHVNTLATLYACADASETGPSAEQREAFNAAIAGVVADLECIADDYATPKAVQP